MNKEFEKNWASLKRYYNEMKFWNEMYKLFISQVNWNDFRFKWTRNWIEPFIFGSHQIHGRTL